MEIVMSLSFIQCREFLDQLRNCIILQKDSVPFTVCKSVHHYTIQINQPTRRNNLSSLLLEVYLQSNIFRASSRPSSGAQQLQQHPLVLPLGRGDSSVAGRGRAARPDHEQQHCYHQAPTVKPEAATAVVELLMMGVRTPETCWTVNKRQVINWINFASALLIYLNSIPCSLLCSQFLDTKKTLSQLQILLCCSKVEENYVLTLSAEVEETYENAN